ncbi:hypothetical protein CBY09_01430 [Acidovorax kalamii]|uniref:Uncharacterized protein n=1 Tax=Acidovorax kalamii TaxID=2004485 RepID=A0A235ET00_9BURK|nr:hypothetical protein CBY09_01430 [Acidovorax kalamii]
MHTRACPAKQHSQISTTFFVLLLAICLGSPKTVLAKRKNSPQTATAPAKQVKVKHLRSPSEESPAARDRRLHRECKGRPNAGACLGYAKP